MRSALFILLLTPHLLWAQLEYGIESFRDYESVVDTFFTSYTDFQQLTPYSHIEFARKPDGWYVQKKNYGDTTSNEILYCSPGLDFQDLSTHFKQDYSLSSRFEQSKNIAISPSTIRQFRIHTYYGYKGWGDDIVNRLESASTPLNDADLYSLARACANVAMSMSSNDLGATRFPKVTFRKTGNSLTESELEFYLVHHDKGLRYFKELSERSPNFKTIVGDIRTKYANETMQGWLDLLIYQGKAAAKERIKEGVYPQDMLTNARNILKGCPPNALLLSFGDNDFYVLHYLQETEKYRTDVAVVNYSLLNLDHYLHMIQREYGLRLKMPMSFYRKVKLLRSASLDTLDWDDLQAQMQAVAGNEGQFTMPANRFRTPDGLVLAKEKYYFKHHLALLDLYVSNRDRPLCGSSRYEPLDLFVDHLTSIGYLWEVRVEGPTVDLDAALSYFKSVDTVAYQDPVWMRKTDQGEFVNPIFAQNMFNAILVIMCYCKEDHPLKFNELNAIYKEWSTHWIVPPRNSTLEWYSTSCD